MLTVYQSNELDILLSKICEIIQKNPLCNIFEKEIIIHDNNTLFQYLNIFISNKIGIAANFKLYHPKNFIYQVFERYLSKKFTKNSFNQSSMIWNIMNVLNKNNIFTKIHQPKNMLKRFKLSYFMAKMFEKYLTYRPNWIDSWESKKDQSAFEKCDIWQIKLWKEIIKDFKKNNKNCDHFSRLFYEFNSLSNHEKKAIKLPIRIFIISSITLNSAYIKIFEILSHNIDVYFLYITAFKQQQYHVQNLHNTYSLSNNTDVIFNQKHHYIISLWKKIENYYSPNIFNFKNSKIINCFKKNKQNTMLHCIKDNFLKNNTLYQKKRKLILKDDSITIHSCDSKQKEIEILYENILFYLKNNKNIKLRDIVVVSYSLSDYIPYINAIFKSKDKKSNLHFYITEEPPKNLKTTLFCFNKLLNLKNSRFENKEILELFDIPEIANNFDISKEDIKILHYWIEESEIRWAIDAKHKNSFLLPENKENTWIWGIEKLLLSYATNKTKMIWKNTVSCALMNNSRSELVGKLYFFINTLKKWKKKLSYKKNILSWRSLSTEIINDFFHQNKRTEKSVQFIQKNWEKMIDNILLSNYDNKISIDILNKYFMLQFQYKKKNFFPSVINFCHPSEICYIPFQIICVIGADYQNTPKKYDLDQINLLHRYPNLGDPNIYKRYFYFLIQILSCCKKFFYVSYVHSNVEQEHGQNPSIFINQLLNYVSSIFFIEGNNKNKATIFNFLCKKYDKQYFYKKIHISYYNKKNTIKNLQKTSSDCKYLKKNILQKIDLKDLILFWKNPIRHFCNHKLKTRLNFMNENCVKTEPFSINTLTAFTIKQTLLNYLIKEKKTQNILQYYTLSGKLPYGFFGQVALEKLNNEMMNLANVVIKERHLTKNETINIRINNFQILGTLSEVQSTGLLRWQPNKIHYHDRMSLWIEHLVYSLKKNYGTSKIIGYKNQIWSFPPMSYHVAFNYLVQYIEGYIIGLQQPTLLTKSGASWLDKVYDKKNNIIKMDENSQSQGYKKFLETWIGNDYVSGEQNDLYVQQVINILNQKYIKKMCQTAQIWFSPILKNKTGKK
ncbi:exodeoxyribonuclease V subunit gamma [Buchnera aphidicola (Hyadaphis tataricae)]|uniref:RecBCD enzyme subunit RecC n=1 Tax=Buchnera aphidicola (Hyadaphis tataricae) TaxID=1241859 RepID=A0A4D6Y5X9_9GAMM|nr:exodeoxyribonuclease V subunit gamma [Buchnera aphidicola]QCI21738.1 exodeoxyribonuclease V subunit gamma [Buchnera aphidicola (Hyadaphis tataricae)]